ILLHGRNHTQLGELAVEQIGDIGVALGRGRHPKAYPYTEPNEDSLVAATDGSFHLMAVADGHNGRLASHSAIEAIDAAIPDLVHLPSAEAVSLACQLAQDKLQSVYSPPESP